MIPNEAQAEDLLGRFREVISNPLNPLIERVPMAGVVEASHVYPHNGGGAYYGPFITRYPDDREP